MIPEKTIRWEKWNGAKYEFQALIDEIPMTSAQRSNIERLLHDLEQLFEEANEGKE